LEHNVPRGLAARLVLLQSLEGTRSLAQPLGNRKLATKHVDSRDFFPQTLFQKIRRVSLQVSTWRIARPLHLNKQKQKIMMKTKSLFLAALVVLSSAVAFAGKEEPRTTGLAVVPVKGSEIYKVIYRGESVGKVKLNIYNAGGILLLTQTFNSVDGFILPVNFSGLTAGDYTIELVDASGKKVEKVSFAAESNIKHVHVTRLSGGQNKFLVSIANGGKERVNLRIYDSAGNLLHTENKLISGDFAQVYNLTKVSEHYTFEVTDAGGNTRSIKF
jgi:hypothetical protein